VLACDLLLEIRHTSLESWVERADTLGMTSACLTPLGSLWIWILLMAAAQPAQSQYRASVLALGAANAADIASSWGKVELNPALGKQFGARGAGVKLSILGGVVLVERLFLRKHPKAQRFVSVLNFGVAGATTAVALHNWRQTQPSYAGTR
jgi:hypothetical protein